MLRKLIGRKTLGSLFVAVFFISILPFLLTPTSQAQLQVEEYPIDEEGYIIDGMFSKYESFVRMVSNLGECRSWFRFKLNDVPQGAIIEKAELKLTPDSSDSDLVPTYTIQAFDQGNATDPESEADWDSRPKTDATVEWMLPPFTQDLEVTSPDLKSVVQEVVNRRAPSPYLIYLGGEWQEGNYLVICSHTNKSLIGSRSCWSWEGTNGLRSPKLRIEWRVVPRDVAVTEVSATPTTVVAGETVSINVTVTNEGEVSEDFTVVAAQTNKSIVILPFDWRSIGSSAVHDLAPGESRLLTFDWNTTGVDEDDYWIKGEVTEVPGETDLNDNWDETEDRVNVIPEFPTILILPLFMAATSLAVIIRRRKHSMQH